MLVIYRQTSTITLWLICKTVYILRVSQALLTLNSMQSVFGFHNSDRVRAFCYATTPSDKSTHRQQIESEAPVFRDVSSWPSEKLVEQIIRDEVHILVNLNGYTRGARNEIFAARPAPIQMSFMGFAGTLGAGWCDYILADTTAIPPETLRPWRQNVSVEDVFRDGTESDEDGWVYSENIIFCRDTFFCCDHAQSCDTNERGMTWAEEQQRRWKMRKELFPTLPDKVIILGNFNQLYKVSHSVTDVVNKQIDPDGARLNRQRFALGYGFLRKFQRQFCGSCGFQS